MREFLILCSSRPLATFELLVASLFINVLALAPPLFFILVFNRYVASGFDGTLITLSVGMVIALLFKAAFGLARNRIAEDVAGDGASVRLHQAFLLLIRARVAGLQRLAGPQALEAVHGPTAQRDAFAPQNICAVFDAPFALFSIVLIFLLNVQLGMLTVAGLILTVGLTLHGQYALRGPAREMGETAATGRHLAAQAYSEQDTIRTFGAQSFLLRLWDTHLQRLQALRTRLFRVEGLTQNLTETSGLLLRAAIIALGAWLVVHGQLSVGAVIGISFLAGLPMALAARFIRALSALAVAREQTQKTRLLRDLPWNRIRVWPKNPFPEASRWRISPLPGLRLPGPCSSP
jgi:ATP-binding cassette, subfamily C, bacterial LapB